MGFPIKIVRQVGLFAGICLLCLPLLAQTNAGRILGIVTDQTGAAITGAEVTITDLERGTTRALFTDTNGNYVAPDLIPAVYKVRAEAKGFKSVERPNIEVQVATDVRIDLLLPTGNIAETVTVTEETPLLNTTSATLGGTLSNKEINEWAQLREPSSTASGRDPLSGRRIFYDQHERTSSGGQCLHH
jgi:hypothetical protein